MSYYLHLDGERVVGVVAAQTNEGLGAAYVEFPAWAGWPTPPDARRRLYLVNGALVWEDPRTLSQAKADKRAEMTAARTAAAVGGFTVLGFTFASDPTSQMRILLGYTKAQAQPAGFSEPWLLANGNVQTLTAANMQTLTLGLWAHIKDQDAHLYALGQQIDAAATVAEVEAIVW